jgi:hypothetical protein
VILHELGHAHGLAHTHDDGGGSEIMLGVTDSSSLGIYDLNQGVYTVMSYNDGWQTHPDGTLEFSRQTLDSGWSGSISAFDIAVLQERYGVHAYNGGNSTYDIAAHQNDAYYTTIWDSGGIDTIAYSGGRNVHIDLLAATLDYTPPAAASSRRRRHLRRLHHRPWRGHRESHRRQRQRRPGRQQRRQHADRQQRQRQPGRPRGRRRAPGRQRQGRPEGRRGRRQPERRGGQGCPERGRRQRHPGRRRRPRHLRLLGPGTDKILGYEHGEKFDLSDLGVTWANVTINATSIEVDLAGPNDLVIQLASTAGISQGDFIFV